jgi:asparagine synthase (glutamine-hydrolysing)
MCGITGIYSLTNNEVNKDLLLRMNNKIRHRGPDDEGYFLSNTQAGSFDYACGKETQEELKASLSPLTQCDFANLGLGFRRLSIQDLSVKGHQPMTDSKERVVIVFNGEVYNFIELREELESKGYSFKSLTDTEVILNAYLEWGEDCVHRFNGMWAFALWDIKEKKLFCSRDRFGIKPFYYTNKNDQFFFASEIKALLECVPAKINKDTLYKYLYYDEIDTSNDTFFEGITQLSPGHSLTIKKGTLNVKRYYILEKKIKLIQNNPVRGFFERFMRAVELRLRSDVSIGFALSGGVDSSSIVGMAHNISGREKKDTFSIVYPGTVIDESSYIDEVIQKIQFNNHKLTPAKEDLKHDLDNFIYYQEEPVPNLSYYNEYKLRSYIQEKKVVVTLEGQGADEIVTGYRSFVLPFYFDLIESFQWKKLLNEIKQFKKLYPQTFFNILLRYCLSKLPQNLVQTLKKIIKKRQNPLINSNYFGSLPNIISPKNKCTNLNSALMNSLRVHSLPKQLTRADKSAMAHSIECRFPFLDHNLVEYSFSLSNDQKMHNGVTKKVLRLAMQEHIPVKVFKRRDKKGFLSPQATWIRELRDVFDLIVYSEEFKKLEYINWIAFEKKYSELITYKHNNSQEIWKILSVFLWEKTFIQN